MRGWRVDSGGYLEYTVYDGEQSSDSEPSASLMCGTGVTPLEVALVQSKMHPVRICNGRKQGLLVGEFFYAKKKAD